MICAEKGFLRLDFYLKKISFETVWEKNPDRRERQNTGSSQEAPKPVPFREARGLCPSLIGRM